MNTGERLRQLRITRSLSQEELSKLLGVQRQIVSYYETGARQPTINDLIKLAREFDTTVDYLLCLSDVRTAETDIEKIERSKIYECTLSAYGLTVQVDMLIEEMAELTTELLHDRRGREANISEEIADVQIMLEQITQFFKLEDAVEIQKDRKLRRLAERLGLGGTEE